MADPAAEPRAEPGRLPSRLGWLDALRGGAVFGMVVYHLAWDLADLGWPVASPSASAAWAVFGDAVAATFLLVSGIGLALARPKGIASALRRLARLTAAGLAVTAASLWFAPDAPILFGILQCIAVADALALAALRWPAAARVALAALAAAAPLAVHVEALDGWPWAALGLSARAPPTLDYRPLLPWLAVAILGTVAGDALRRRPCAHAKRVPGAALLGWAGRHSLALYLLHQPALYGALVLAGTAVGQPDKGAEPVVLQCRADCAATGASGKLCAVACACVARRLSGEVVGGTEALTQRHLDEVGEACRRSGG